LKHGTLSLSVFFCRSEEKKMGAGTKVGKEDSDVIVLEDQAMGGDDEIPADSGQFQHFQ
jgi:hypothetical protein